MSTLVLRCLGSLALLSAATLAACSSKDKTSADTTSTTPAATPPATASMPATTSSTPADSTATDPSRFTDANILAMETAGDSAEISIAGLAKRMARSAAVKAYAAQLVTDHGKGMSEVHTLAQKLAITPQMPAGDTTAQATSHVMSRLQGLTGAAFDSAFVNHAIEDHQKDIQDAKAMSGAAQNAEVKALLDKTLPELQRHLDRAQKLMQHSLK
ncbi:MAG: hypothetical protein JWM95_4845 [Gemmatimonadetes bacterium]|nr:hypothetical protein [Gemmatimonadota bacterium]